MLKLLLIVAMSPLLISMFLYVRLDCMFLFVSKYFAHPSIICLFIWGQVLLWQCIRVGFCSAKLFKHFSNVSFYVTLCWQTALKILKTFFSLAKKKKISKLLKQIPDCKWREKESFERRFIVLFGFNRLNSNIFFFDWYYWKSNQENDRKYTFQLKALLGLF